jgi:hypothetical protein
MHLVSITRFQELANFQLNFATTPKKLPVCRCQFPSANSKKLSGSARRLHIQCLDNEPRIFKEEKN